ncbi:MAG TPA: dTDP-4-amino-4,6-dideoxygalactose transaminase [Gemmatimonadales bacterium]
MSAPIPFNRPFVDQREIEAVARVLRGDTLRGNGPVARRVEESLRQWLGVAHAYLTTSCTHALEMAMLVLGVKRGDEVIMPSFTFVSTANAVVLRGACPVFADIGADTLNIDPVDVERRVTPRTRAVIVVHYAGVACDMEAITDLARRRGLVIVEDAAQGIDARHSGRPLGAIGQIGCLSFHDTKNIMCGEGGAFLTNDPAAARSAELIREKGTNRAGFLRGEVDRYTWVSEGSSYVPSDILASVLEVQIAKRAEIKARRRVVWEAYFRALEPLAARGQVVRPVVPPYAEPNYHIFFFRVRTAALRDRVLAALAAAGIGATFHFIPLHSSPFGRQVTGRPESLPVTDECSSTLVRLPVYPDLSDGADAIAGRVAEIVDALTR